MRILILNADYPAFLRQLYAGYDGLKGASYAEQLEARNNSLFGVADFYSRNFRAQGHTAEEVHVNNRWLQFAWAREHGVSIEPPEAASGPTPRHRSQSVARALRLVKPALMPFLRPFRNTQLPEWEATALDARIEHFAPDVILNQSMEYVRSNALGRHRNGRRLIVGQIAAPRPYGENYAVYDMVISSLRNFVVWFEAHGVRSRWNQLAFEPSVLNAMGPQPQRDIPLSFVGSLSPEHRHRIELLEHIARRAPLKVWGSGIERLPRESPLHACYQGEAWGRSMYDVLRRSRITLNHHIDLAEGWANNMRLYEATGMGALLLTDRQRNINEIYLGGEEVATYGSVDECLAAVERYLSDETARAAIALAGQRRAIEKNNYRVRTGEILQHIAEITPRGATT